VLRKRRTLTHRLELSESSIGVGNGARLAEEVAVGTGGCNAKSQSERRSDHAPAREYSSSSPEHAVWISSRLTCILDGNVVKAALTLDRDSLTPRRLVEVLGPLAFALGQLVRKLLAQAFFVFPGCESEEYIAEQSLISHSVAMA
jgi:hypothetical protein